MAYSVVPLLHDWLCSLAISQNSSRQLHSTHLLPLQKFSSSLWPQCRAYFFRPSIRLFTRTANCPHSPMTCFSVFNSRALAKILSTPSLIGNRVKYLSTLMSALKATDLSQKPESETPSPSGHELPILFIHMNNISSQVHT